LSHSVNFATSTQNESSIAVNIFIDITRKSASYACPIINGLSDNDAQVFTVNKIAAATNIVPLKQRTREINNEGIMQFQLHLANETL
jgi:ribosomal protein L22